MAKYVVFFGLLACGILLSAQTNTSNDEAQIRTARAASNYAISMHDVDGLARCLTDNFIMVTGNAMQFVGKDAVMARWKTFFANNPNVSYIRRPLQIIISKNDTLAWETGKWEAVNSYSAGGNYSAMWCKRNGVWLTRMELFVSMEK